MLLVSRFSSPSSSLWSSIRRRIYADLRRYLGSEVSRIRSVIPNSLVLISMSESRSISSPVSMSSDSTLSALEEGEVVRSVAVLGPLPGWPARVGPRSFACVSARVVPSSLADPLAPFVGWVRHPAVVAVVADDAHLTPCLCRSCAFLASVARPGCPPVRFVDIFAPEFQFCDPGHPWVCAPCFMAAASSFLSSPVGTIPFHPACSCLHCACTSCYG